MADEKDEAAATAKPQAQAAQKAKPTDAEFKNTSYRVQASAKMVGSLYDPDRKVRISKSSDVKVTGPIPEGSWLYCQIKAGLVDFVAD